MSDAEEVVDYIDGFLSRQHWCHCGRLTPPEEAAGPCPNCNATDIPSMTERLSHDDS